MTESSTRLAATAQAYDTWAVRYADLARDELEGLPLDRAVLAAFADYVRATDSDAAGPGSWRSAAGLGGSRPTWTDSDLRCPASTCRRS